MGHMYPEKLSVAMIRRIYAKGKATIKEVIGICQKKGIELECGEGNYSDEGMLSMGLEFATRHARQQGFIEPILDEPLHKNVWDQLDKDPDPEDVWEIYNEIPWRFAKGGRKAYLDKKIKHLTFVEL